MAFKKLPEHALLLQLLDYQSDTGLLFWRPRPPELFGRGRWGREASAQCWNGAFAGKPALNKVDHAGYCRGLIFRESFMAHRVIWKYVHGSDPECTIDHINLNRMDNRIENLREATFSENRRNQQRSSANTSGKVGVVWNKNEKKWMATIRDDERRRFLGYFRRFEDAVVARQAAEKELGYTIIE